MKRFPIAQSETEILTSNAGLALVGQMLSRHTSIDHTLAQHLRSNSIADSDLIKFYAGMLCTGKNDFDAIENFRNDTWFAEALGVKHVPSASVSTRKSRSCSHKSTN